MELTLHISWWLAPTVITVLAFTAAALKFVPTGNYGAGGIWNSILLLLAAVASLVAWLTYFIAT